MLYNVYTLRNGKDKTTMVFNLKTRADAQAMREVYNKIYSNGAEYKGLRAHFEKQAELK